MARGIPYTRSTGDGRGAAEVTPVMRFSARRACLVVEGALQPSGTNSSNTQHKIRSADGCVVPEGDPPGKLSKWTRAGLSKGKVLQS